MSTNPNNISIPSREQFGLPPLDNDRRDSDIPTVAVATPGVIPTPQLEWIMSSIAKLDSRLAASEQRAAEHRAPPLPDPPPPYAIPLSSAVQESQPLQQPFFQAVRDNALHNQPLITSQSSNFPPQQGFQLPHPGFHLPQPSTTPLFHTAHDQEFHSSFRIPTTYPQSWQNTIPSQGFTSSFDRQNYTPPLGPRPTSCWYPSMDRPPRGHPLQDQHRGVRLDPPRFDGSDAANWIFKIQYYFDHMMMPDSNRLHYVVPLFDPPASEWIKHYCSNNDYVTWQEFLNEVRYRFDPDCYESYIGLIAKLCQTGTVSEYQFEFEKLQNKLSGVPDYILLPIYVAGLKQPLQREVKLHRPTTLAAAFALAKELSACRPEHQQSPSNFQHKPWIPRESKTTYSPSPTPNTTAASSFQGPRPSGGRFQELGKLPVVRLSASEKADRSRRGLCWYCEDKWAPGHVCNHNFLAYMGANADDDDIEVIESELPEDNIITADLSHLDTVDARKRSRSIHMHGSIQHMAVTILVDNGSSHDFIHPTIAEKLRLPSTPITPFRVYVGTGESLLCSNVSKQTVVDIQGHLFSIDLHILAFHGPDIILGMEWLESLGRVTHDYLARTMEFFRDDALVVLRGLSTLPRRISTTALTTLMSHTDKLDFFEIVDSPAAQPMDQPRLKVDFPQELTPPVLHVLSQFSADSASQIVVTLREEFLMLRPFVQLVRLLDQWSDSNDVSPAWEPLRSFSSHVPSLILEDKDTVIGGGVDTSTSTLEPASQPEKSDDDSVEEDLAASTSKIPPRRLRRAPALFKDYVGR